MKILLLLFIFLPSCSSQNDNSVIDLSKIAKDGNWAGAPESPNKKPYDYFYLLQKGNVKSRVKPELMEKACVDSVRKNGYDLILRRASEITMQGTTAQEWNIDFAGHNFKKLKENNFKLEIKNCYSTSFEIEWKNCECLTYIYIPNGRDRIIDIITKYESPR